MWKGGGKCDKSSHQKKMKEPKNSGEVSISKKLTLFLTCYFKNYTKEQNKKRKVVWNISPDSTLLGVTDA